MSATKQQGKDTGAADDDLTLPVPSLNICFLVVGTHGDINPFLGLADRLVELGHRVRVATHQQHRKLVLTSGHDFYPLAGDARRLSEWMVQTGGTAFYYIAFECTKRVFLRPPLGICICFYLYVSVSLNLLHSFSPFLTTTGTVMGEAKHLDVVPQKTAMAKQILASTWGAVTQPSPDDIDSKLFEADAVIANPPVFGHIHVSEALGIPLHIMFPQPWYYGTRDYPHPLMGMSYENKTDSNFASYATFEAILFSSMAFFLNKWRRTKLDVPVLYLGNGAATCIPSSKVPFSAMWSPSFVPKPEEYVRPADLPSSHTLSFLLTICYALPPLH